MKEDKKHKILYFVQLPPPVHGVSLMNHYITSSKLINEGFSKRILRLHFSNTIDELRKKCIKKIYLFLLHLFKLVLLLLKFKPDLVYFSIMPVGIGFLRDLIFVFILKVSNVTLLYHLNNRGIEKYAPKWYWRKLYEYVFSNSNIIHVSEVLLKREIGILDLKNTRTFVVGNTIKPFKIKVYENKDGHIELLFTSNYLPEKGLMVLLEAAVLLKKEKLNFFLNTYGSSYSKEENLRYQKYIQENKLGEYVQVNGPVYDDDKYKILAKADIFIFPSYFSEECFPLSILEAMNAGLPIIATKIGAIPEMLEDGKEGILVDPLSVNQLVFNILKLGKNKLLRLQLGENAYNKFKKHYASDIFENKLIDIFLLTIHN